LHIVERELNPMALSKGTILGTYEIVDSLGAGGMGEVYRANDSKLGRKVAIKVLPEGLASNAERVARLDREAHLLASLNHPNIAAIYDLAESNGTRFLVMELVPGETLAETIQRGPVPVDEVIGICRQIAEAVEAAHDKGIVHRDLKPANVKITPDGKVKVLDFGLAKFSDPAEAPASPSQFPTRTAQGTMHGVILGTVAYMSPEQTRGKEVDRRSDIWSFGCIAFELLTGKPPFAAETVSDLFASILTREPDWNELPESTPDSLRRLLERCLQKDPRRRLQHIGEARIALDEVGALQPAPQAPSTAQAVGQTRRRTFWMATIAVLVLAAIGLAAAVAQLYRSIEEPRVVRFYFSAPDKAVFTGGDTNNFMLPSISPDGRRVAFTARDSAGKTLLWVRSLDTLTPQALTGTDGASRPFWSPDSRSIAFFADGRLKRIDAVGGSVRNLCEAVQPRGGTWNRDDVLLFAASSNGPIFRVAAGGGQPVAVTKVVEGQFSHRAPSFLPDGRHFLYYVLGQAGGVFMGSLESPESKRLASADSGALYSASGDLLFMRQGNLLRQSFDLRNLVLHGDPTPVAEQVGIGAGQANSLFRRTALWFTKREALVMRS
jgi:serine/threonine protein kinase